MDLDLGEIQTAMPRHSLDAFAHDSPDGYKEVVPGPKEGSPFPIEGWFKSGDLGFQDPGDNLRLYLSGRAKELIITGGENVYPKEIENILEDHAAVQESAVFGLINEDFGEQVTAAVVLKEGVSLEALELIDFCKTRLAGYKCPKKIFFRSVLPRNSMGKLQKHLLQKEYDSVRK